MGIEEIKPPIETVEDKPDANHIKIRINKNDMHETMRIATITHPAFGVLGYLHWVGIVNGKEIFQPAIITPRQLNTFLSYEGRVNFFEQSDVNNNQSLRFPCDKSIFKMIPAEFHFFKTNDILTPEPKYSLRFNNTSFIIDNISIYNADYTGGGMINLRASFEGMKQHDEIDGNVVILCSIDYLG